eukprot:gene4399-biopygen3644
MPLLFPIALLLAAPAQAAPPPAPPIAGPPQPSTQPTMVVEPVAMMIAACDADNDGRVTRAELTACVTRSFAAVDETHSGSIGYIGYSDWALKWLRATPRRVG